MAAPSYPEGVCSEPKVTAVPVPMYLTGREGSEGSGIGAERREHLERRRLGPVPLLARPTRPPPGCGTRQGKTRNPCSHKEAGGHGLRDRRLKAELHVLPEGGMSTLIAPQATYQRFMAR